MPTQIVTPLAKTGRRMRRPQHTFQLKHRPWQIQPCFIAPVAPGETMKNLLLQSRAVSKPLANPLIGWWLEYYVFYVKLRDLNDRDALTQMLLDPGWTNTLNSAAKTATDHYATSIDYVQLCMERVVETYFRGDGEAYSDFLLDSMPLAQINHQSWSESVLFDDEITSVDFNVDLNADTTITASEVERALLQWDALRNSGLTDMTYEDYLRSFGLRVPDTAEEHKPELVRFVRNWTYPTNTIDPSDGSPTSAVSWAVAERADKDRFFREPGFLCGYTVARPKVYLKNYAGQAASLLNNALAWLPQIMAADPAATRQKLAQGAGPLSVFTDTDGYWVDIKDLYLYGDQFINFAKTATDANIVALPTATDAQTRYASSTDADGLFAGASPANTVMQDGIVSLSILSPMSPDMSPPRPA